MNSDNYEARARDEMTDVQLTFRPMLATQSKIVSTFLAIPISEFANGRYESGYQVLRNSTDPQAILDLDRFVLDHAAVELQRIISTGGRSLMAIPVHFETLANPARARNYCAFGAETLAGIEKRIVFEIVALPEKIPQARLIQLVSLLSQFSRAVIGRFPLESGNFGDYRAAGLHAVGLDVYGPAKSERTIMQYMDRFAEAARRERLKTYVHGVRSLSLLTASITSGFDYISGHVLGTPCSHAEDVRMFELGSTYKALIETLTASQNGAHCNDDIMTLDSRAA